MKNKIPRWLELQAEIDYWHFILGMMQNEEKNRTPIERMIDESTGFGKKRLEEAKKIITNVENLKKEFYKLTK